ncbi:MAG: hypothetical protein IJV62_02670, partial [Eggerthellaceae bacterium]|nr:hypothetical protein [Eggerthellaceae bacterium]
MRKVYDNTKNVLVIEPVLHRDPKGTVNISAPRRFGKQIAYSQPVRSMFSKAVNSAAHDGIYSVIKQAPKLYDVVRKISHPPLPEGLFYAKLFIYGWQAIDGKRFRLMHKGACVYGTTCEPPQKGFQLEYRNIVVTSTNYEEFALEIEDADKNLLSGDIEFRLVFSKTQFSTPQQDAYDLKYGVEFKDGIYYSLRGNTKNPKKLIVTFPGFGSSTARVQYAVSYLGALDDDDLSETCLIALQDRYGVSGTFLIYDDAGYPLQSRIENFINFYVEKFNIAQHNILFFGGSKGATCALYHFKPYKEAIFVGGTSAMNLPHRLKAN